MNPRAIVLIALIIVVMIAIKFGGRLRASRRLGNYDEFAAEHGWSLRTEPDPSLTDEFAFIDQIRTGRNQHGMNALRGTHHGIEAVAFTNRQEKSRLAENNTTSSIEYHDVFHSVVALRVNGNYMHLKLRKEGLFEKIGQDPLGDDIDIDTAPEFSKRFAMYCEHKVWANEFAHPQMIEHLMSRNPGAIDLRGQWLTEVRNGHLDSDDLEERLEHLRSIAALLPASP